MKNVITETLQILEKSYTHIFILLSVCVGCSFLIGLLFDIKSNFNGFNSTFFLYLTINSFNYLLFYTLTLNACYQIDNIRSKQCYNDYLYENDWVKTVFDCIENMPKVVAIYMLYTARAVIPSLIIGIIVLHVLASGPGDSFGIGLMSLTIAAIVFLIYFTKLLASMSIATLMIVSKNTSLITSVKTTSTLLKIKGQQSFFYMTLFVIFKLALMSFLLFNPLCPIEAAELICLPLHACLTISLAKHLE